MDEVQAAVLDVKLKYLEEDNACRKEIAQYFEQNIKNDSIIIPKALNRDNVYHIFPILCVERNRLQEFLKENGVQTMIHYPIPPISKKHIRNGMNYRFL